MAQMKGKENFGVMLWFEHEEEWNFVAQVSVSARTSDVKIDPLRGQSRGHETPEETATRELYEESSGLFDLRNSTLAFAKRPKIREGDGEIFHLRVIFDSSSSVNAVTPASLINDYRNNRRALDGCDEILDLAIEPQSRLDHQNTYPRLAQQTREILSKLKENISDVSSVHLHRLTFSKLTTYRFDPEETGLEFDLAGLKLKEDRLAYHPLLLNGPAWESWIIDHDENREKKIEKKCLVSQINSTYQFVDRMTGICSKVFSDKHFGFIEGDQVGHIFFHFSALDKRSKIQAQVGDKFKFYTETNKNGQLKAVEIMIATAPRSAGKSLNHKTILDPSKFEERKIGKCTGINYIKNYGFIEQAHGDNIFFHFSNISSAYEQHSSISVGNTLEFCVEQDEHGRRCATDVKQVQISDEAVPLLSDRTSENSEEGFTVVRSKRG